LNSKPLRVYDPNLMEYKTADRHIVSDKKLEAEAQLFEKGERPNVWLEPESLRQTDTVPSPLSKAE
jgi:hypothetical protein